MSVKFKFDTNKLNQHIQNQASSILNQRTYDVECPHYKTKVTVPTGKSFCPICRNVIDLSLNINFKR